MAEKEDRTSKILQNEKTSSIQIEKVCLRDRHTV